MNLTGVIGRAVYAVLVGVVTFIILFIIGLLVSKVAGGSDIGAFIEKFAALVGLLAGLADFFTGFASRRTNA